MAITKVFTLPSGGGAPNIMRITIPGDMFVATKIIGPFDMGAGMVISKIKLTIDSAPTGADLIIDVNKNGTTIFTTQANRPKILAGTTSRTSVAPDITTFADGDILTIDIDQIGSTLPGTKLGITIVGS